MKKALFNSNGICVGLVNGDVGIQIPDSLTDIPHAFLRLNQSGKIESISSATDFYIDDEGRKHLYQQDESQQFISCNHDDVLVKDSDIWRVENENDIYQEQRKTVDEKRESEYTSRVRPFLEEAEIKKHMGNQAEYTRLMDLAVQERELIQTENPWPTPPEV